MSQVTPLAAIQLSHPTPPICGVPSNVSLRAHTVSHSRCVMHEVDVSKIFQGIQTNLRRIQVLTPENWTAEQAAAFALREEYPSTAKVRQHARKLLEGLNTDYATILPN